MLIPYYKIRLLLGTDLPQIYSVPGFSIQREMQSLAAAGLSPQQILGEATFQVARYFAAEQEFAPCEIHPLTARTATEAG